MIALTSSNVVEASNKIDHFISTTISLYYEEEQKQVKKVFEQHPIRVQVGDFYFYREKNDGYDYFIALFKHDENKLYTFEWHQ